VDPPLKSPAGLIDSCMAALKQMLPRRLGKENSPPV